MTYPPPPPPPLHNDPSMLERNGGYHEKTVSNSVVVFLNVVNTLTHLFIGAVAFSAFSYAQAYTVQTAFTQHIYLCVTGYVILMSQAILSMNPHAGWAQNLKYPQKRIIHAVMQIMGSILAIAGSVIMIIETNRYDISLESAHGITGLIALLLTVLSLIGGCVNFAFAEKPNANLFKTAHSCFGSLTITVAFATLVLGFTNYYRIGFGDTNANLSITYTIFALIGVLTSSSFQIFKRAVG